MLLHHLITSDGDLESALVILVYVVQIDDKNCISLMMQL